MMDEEQLYEAIEMTIAVFGREIEKSEKGLYWARRLARFHNLLASIHIFPIHGTPTSSA